MDPILLLGSVCVVYTAYELGLAVWRSRSGSRVSSAAGLPVLPGFGARDGGSGRPIRVTVDRRRSR